MLSEHEVCWRTSYIIPVLLERAESTVGQLLGKWTWNRVHSASPRPAEVADSPWGGTGGDEFTLGLHG